LVALFLTVSQGEKRLQGQEHLIRCRPPKKEVKKIIQCMDNLQNGAEMEHDYLKLFYEFFTWLDL